LQPVLGHEGVAQLRDDRVVLEPLERRHVGPFAHDRVGDAGARRCAVEQDRAGPAHALLAAKMCRGELQLLSQEVREMRARLRGAAHVPAI
jgi:hypothetical protein